MSAIISQMVRGAVQSLRTAFHPRSLCRSYVNKAEQAQHILDRIETLCNAHDFYQSKIYPEDTWSVPIVSANVAYQKFVKECASIRVSLSLTLTFHYLSGSIVRKVKVESIRDEQGEEIWKRVVIPAFDVWIRDRHYRFVYVPP